ncbi:unnamed protein product, partial [Symbiodinium microadriaticum]
HVRRRRHHGRQQSWRRRGGQERPAQLRLHPVGRAALQAVLSPERSRRLRWQVAVAWHQST